MNSSQEVNFDNNDKKFLECLADLGLHYGNVIKTPGMEKYLYFNYRGCWIFDLEKIAPIFQEAIQRLRTAIFNKEKILIVHCPESNENDPIKRDDPVKCYIEELGLRYGQAYITSRYPGGFLSNKEAVVSSVEKLKIYEKTLQQGKFSGKKEKRIKMFINRANKKWEGIKLKKHEFSLILALNCKQLRILAKEAKITGTELIALCDSNTKTEVLNNISYVIPGNNSSKVCSFLLREGIENPLKIMEAEKNNKISNIEEVK